MGGGNFTRNAPDFNFNFNCNRSCAPRARALRPTHPLPQVVLLCVFYAFILVGNHDGEESTTVCRQYAIRTTECYLDVCEVPPSHSTAAPAPTESNRVDRQSR